MIQPSQRFILETEFKTGNLSQICLFQTCESRKYAFFCPFSGSGVGPSATYLISFSDITSSTILEGEEGEKRRFPLRKTSLATLPSRTRNYSGIPATLQNFLSQNLSLTQNGFLRGRGPLFTMGRINVENKLFERGEWFQLLVSTGSPDTALGALVRAWNVAQRYWFPDRQPIPKDVWVREKLNQAVIDAGLAEERDGGVYVRGSSEQFAWLFEASEKGKKSAAARKKKTGTAQPGEKLPRKPRKTVEHSSNTVQPGSNTAEQLSTSLLSSLNSSLSSPDSNSDRVTEPPAPIGNELVQEFYDRWREKHGGKAPLLPKDHKRLKELGEQLGMPRARALVTGYFKVSNTWFTTKKHDVETLMQNLSEVQAFVDRNTRGRLTTDGGPVPVKVDHCVGPLTDDGPRTLSPERLSLLKKTMGVG